MFVAHEFIIPNHGDEEVNESSSVPVNVIYKATRRDGVVQEVTFVAEPSKGLVVLNGIIHGKKGDEKSMEGEISESKHLPFHPYTKYGDVLVALPGGSTSRKALLDSLRREYGNVVYNID